MALNKATLMGRLTSDPELRSTNSGKSVINFTLAVDKPYNKENDHPEANFIDVVAWNSTAENISKFFSKGSRIIVDGSLQTRTYEDKDGKKRKSTEVLVNSFEFVDRKSDVLSAEKENNAPDNIVDDSSDSDDLPY